MIHTSDPTTIQIAALQREGFAVELGAALAARGIERRREQARQAREAHDWAEEITSRR